MNIYFKRRNREVKTSSSALFISFTEKEIFQFFYPAYPKKKKSVVWHLLSSKERKITKLYVYEWRKRRHAPIVMHKIIVFLKTYYGKYICLYICNQHEASFCLNRLCQHPPLPIPFFNVHYNNIRTIQFLLLKYLSRTFRRSKIS